MTAARLLTPIVALLSGCGPIGLTDYTESGLVGASLFIIPEAQVRFAPTPPGGVDYTDITLISSGDTSVRVEEIWLEGEDADDFRIRGDIAVPLDLIPGAEMSITLGFTPALSGPSSATIVVGMDRLGASEISRGIFGKGCDDEDYDGRCD